MYLEKIELKNFTESLGVIYLSTPFSRSAADFLNEINVAGFRWNVRDELYLNNGCSSQSHTYDMSTNTTNIKNYFRNHRRSKAIYSTQSHMYLYNSTDPNV